MRGIAAATIAGVFTTIFGTAGLAADLARPVTKAPAVAPFSWTGFYVGGHAGYGWADTGATVTAAPAGVFDAQAFNLGGDGVVGGAQIGYNWHFAPNWLVGIEADISGTGINDRDFAMATIAGAPTAVRSNEVSRDIDWVATLRGRLGYTWDRSMLYVTGGFAWADIRANALANINGGPFPASGSETVSGWTIGGGFERAFAPNWSARVEYLYYDLDGFSGPTQLYVNMPASSAATNWSETELHVVRAGVNYRFGDYAVSAYAADPRMVVKASAASGPFSWTGLYVGGHAGYGWSDTDVTLTSLPAFAFDAHTFKRNGDGVVAGAQIGYNWHFAPNWLVGIEADISGTGINDNGAEMGTFNGFPILTWHHSVNRDIDWIATLRGRLGYAWDRSMLYVTGGFAWADIKADTVTSIVGFPLVASLRDTVSGYAIGGGYEWAFASNWSARVEYLYYDLDGFSGAMQPNPLLAGGGGTVTVSDTELHVLRAGVNYRF